MTAIEISDTALQLTNLIGGEQLPAANGETFASIDPQDGSVVSVAPRGGAADADRAIAAARTAFDSGPWPQMSGEERGRLLHALADLIEANGDELALLETRDTGRPIATTIRLDIPRAASNLRFFADYA